MPRKKVQSKITKSPGPLSVAEPAVAYIAAKGKKQKTLKPLTDADWVRPGRPATDEEMEKLAEEMMKETEWFTTDEIRLHAKEWRKKKLG